MLAAIGEVAASTVDGDAAAVWNFCCALLQMLEE
jgi:hypothetical protein